MTQDSPLTLLLIEDNPGDVRYIEEILKDAEELADRIADADEDVLADGASVHASGSPELLHEKRLAEGIDRLEAEQPDAILLDLNLPDSDGLNSLTNVLEVTDSVPIIVLTGLRDRETGLEALNRGAEEYLVKDELTADLLVRSIYHAIERHAHERRLERQRERLAALNQLNEVVRKVTDLAIEQSTREEIERTVCEALAASDAYEFAWIGAVESRGGTVSVRAEAGIEGYLEGTTVSVEPDEGSTASPAARAISAHERWIVTRDDVDADFEHWREAAREHGFRSSASIPVVHEETMYGVLNVYTARSGGFAGEERDVIGHLGEMVGHAIAAVERKQTLMSDEVTELVLRVPNVLEEYEDAPTTEDRISFDRVVPVGDDDYLVYGTTTADARDALEDLVDAIPHWTAVEVDAPTDGEVRFELRQTEPPVVSSVAAHGGHVEAAYLEGGHYYLTVHLSHGGDVRRLVEHVRDRYPDADVRAQRQVSGSPTGTDRVASAFQEELTERQRVVAETAFHKGYFEWPRESTGEEIADTLDIAAATFSQHIREAQNRVFEALFDETEDEKR